MNDLRESSIAGKWKHEYYCRHCKAKTGHEEFMTSICLSCGTYSSGNCMCSRASREYIKDGSRRIQHHYKDGSFGYSDYYSVSGIPPAAICAIAAFILFFFFVVLP